MTPSPRVDGERLLKVPQAARRWTCSERTIWRYIKAGKIVPVRLPSGAIRIPLSQLLTRPYSTDN